MTPQYEKLVEILREMFQMDQADLDFGIYRIMNAKRAEIEKFLKDDLLPQVQAEFSNYRGTTIEDKKKELADLEKKIRNELKMDPNEVPSVKELRAIISKCGDDAALANEVFSHLASFFRRYYDNGDFLSLRRYKKDTYAIPYEGEEVKLHWANSDQYYIKSSEFLKDYSFKLPRGKKAHFKLVDATQERDNNKTQAGKERRFIINEAEPVVIKGDECFIQFVYLSDKDKQDKHNKKSVEILKGEFAKSLKDFQDLFEKAPTEKNKDRTLLEKHLEGYTARFNFDFFIHKDLGSFLRRELDFYIKNEVLFVDDLDVKDDGKLHSTVAKVKVLKHIAHKIIAFLAQLEDFQKKLWLKKKFVVESGWCITLDRIPENLYPEIAKNAAQREEWIRLFAIDVIEDDLTGPGYSSPLKIDFLKANPYLLLDTKHFDGNFREKLLSVFENIDNSCDGTLINTDNFQGLNLLSQKYYEKLKQIYIDPPYNTKASEIVYKNDYKHSSWLSLISDRLSLAKRFLNHQGVISVAIDDFESCKLQSCLDQIFGFESRLGTIVVVHNPGGRHDDKFIATSHEYSFFYAKSIENATTNYLPLEESDIETFDREDEDGSYRTREFRRSGNNSLREERPNMFYPLLIKDGRLEFITDEEYAAIYNKTTKNFDDAFLNKLTAKYEKSGYYVLLPVDPNNIYRVWRWSLDTLRERKEVLIVESKGISYTIKVKDRLDDKLGLKPKSAWFKSKYTAALGTGTLKSIIGIENKFSYPKSLDTVVDSVRIGSNPDSVVMDFFAGSGTTGHAVISLNRIAKQKDAESPQRKYILIEMGEYFNTVLKPRIQKVIYSEDWKDGKPISRKGISHMFKYMRLESYDDALDNLVVRRSQEQEKALEKLGKEAKEDYTLSYMLDLESKGSDCLLNIEKFSDPFNYTLNIRKDNELKPCKVDLVETFNYLIGLNVEQMSTIRGFKVLSGKLRTGEKTLVIWRNTREKSNAELDEFFRKHEYKTKDSEFDLIFVNGDNNLENLKVAEDKWKVCLIEEEFKKRMFEAVN